MTGGATTASDHPTRWKFDFPIFHPADLAAWRSWLEHHHRTERGVWVASWKKASGRPTVAYEKLVGEAIAFGWIDSTVNRLDEERGLQLMTPRKPKSSWTRLNRRRVAELEADGRMTDARRTRRLERLPANGPQADALVGHHRRQARDQGHPRRQDRDGGGTRPPRRRLSCRHHWRSALGLALCSPSGQVVA